MDVGRLGCGLIDLIKKNYQLVPPSCSVSSCSLSACSALIQSGFVMVVGSSFP